MEYEKDNVYKKYKERVGDIVTGEVYQVWKKEILVLDDEEIELILPKSEQIPSDYYRKGDNIRAVVSKVDMRNNNTGDYISPELHQFFLNVCSKLKFRRFMMASLPLKILFVFLAKEQKLLLNHTMTGSTLLVHV